MSELGFQRFAFIDESSSQNCKICGFKADGMHYNCLTCLKCKTFFRRAVLNRQQQICENPSKCPQVKFCRACRYTRCLEMGMSKTFLRPKRDVIKFRKGHKTFNPNIPALDDNLLHIIKSLTAMDKKIRKKKFETIRIKQEAQKLAKQVNPGRMEEPANEPHGMPLMAKPDVAIVTQIEVLMMLEWTRHIPEFQTLPLADRVTLMKRFSVNHLILEHGYYTANSEFEDIWLISNGTYMPKTINVMPDEVKKGVPRERMWRQEKLYTRMTNRCIDEVATPLKKLKLLPEELLTLKIIMLFNCGNHAHEEESALPVEESTRKLMIACRDKIIKGLFEFYKSIDFKNYPERFGNVILTISGIFSASTTLLETYQIMRFFDLAVFDHLSEQLLFNTINLQT